MSGRPSRTSARVPVSDYPKPEGCAQGVAPRVDGWPIAEGAKRSRKHVLRSVASRVVVARPSPPSARELRDALAEALAQALFAEMRGISSRSVNTPGGCNRPAGDPETRK
jgi:hypothetical protein